MVPGCPAPPAQSILGSAPPIGLDVSSASPAMRDAPPASPIARDAPSASPIPGWEEQSCEHASASWLAVRDTSPVDRDAPSAAPFEPSWGVPPAVPDDPPVQNLQSPSPELRDVPSASPIAREADVFDALANTEAREPSECRVAARQIDALPDRLEVSAAPLCAAPARLHVHDAQRGIRKRGNG
jgi:hypothetical protein